MYIKIVEKKIGAKKFFGPLSQRKHGPEKKKTPKMANFRPKKVKIWPKNELLKFFIINPLKGSKTRKLAKNYKFPVIIFQVVGFFRVKNLFWRIRPLYRWIFDYLETNMILRRLKIIVSTSVEKWWWWFRAPYIQLICGYVPPDGENNIALSRPFYLRNH